MPMKWVEPAVFITAEETTVCPVYRAYKDGKWNNMMHFHFTTSSLEREEYQFDVRDLPTWKASSGNRRRAIIEAMQQGMLNVPQER